MSMSSVSSSKWGPRRCSGQSRVSVEAECSLDSFLYLPLMASLSLVLAIVFQ